MRILNSKFVVNASAATAGLLLAAPANAAGLPQLNISTYSAQVAWLVITFVLLYVMMSKVALPRIGEVLEERQSKIDENLSKAEDLKAQAEAASDAYETSLSTARSNAQTAIRDVKDQAQAEATERQSALNEKLQVQIASSEKAILSARDDALTGIKDVATDVTTSLVEKLLGDAPTSKTVDGAIKATLKARA